MAHRLPQHRCCGLIEAVDKPAPPRGNYTTFRSIDAAASLKPHRRPELRHQAPAFRSIDAAASLKPEPDVRKLPAARTFRSIDAAASLKPGVDTAVGSQMGGLPQHRCCGLIEARLAL